MSEVIVGKYKGRYLTAKGQQFVLLAAPTGANKGVAVVLPNLLNFDDSVVVFDLKLENFKLTSRFRQRHGQQVYLFAPFAEGRATHRWNMLDTVSRDPIFRVGDVLAIGQVFYPGDCDPREKFWNDNARNLFLAFVLYLMETPALPCTLGEVFRQSSGKGRPLKEHIQHCIAEHETQGQPLSTECLDAFNRFLASPENTLGNISSTFNAPLLVFANPLVDAATSATDFDIRDLRRKRMSLYIGIQPQRLGDAALLVNMLFSRIIELNTKELPENNPALAYQCLLIMDEFTALGKVNIIAKANSFIRGYNLRLLTIIQSVAQLEGVYGAADTRTLMTNHSLQIIFPPSEQKDANDYSEMLGYSTETAVSQGSSRQRGFGQNGSTSENRSDQRRALMLPQELKEMAQHQQIILVKHCKPILCEKARYYEDHAFLDRLKLVSPSLALLDHTRWRALLPLLRVLHLERFIKVRPTEAQIKHAAFVLGELSSPVPVVNIDLHRARVEQRIRPLAAGEAIDLASLAIEHAALPPLHGAPIPAPESIEAVVDQFFAQLAWRNDATSEPDEEADEDSGNAVQAEAAAIERGEAADTANPANAADLAGTAGTTASSGAALPVVGIDSAKRPMRKRRGAAAQGPSGQVDWIDLTQLDE